MVTTTEILQTIPKLSQKDCFRIAETLLETLRTQAVPSHAQINQQLEIAAMLAVEDYTNDPELSAFTTLEGEEFCDYE